jgi:adenylate kinase
MTEIFGRTLNIVLLGGPGAGKGTLAKQLKDEFGYYILSPGVLYRREAELETEFGIKAKSYWACGSLCPDEMTNELVRSEISKLNNTKIIFDGYPRTDVQAKFLDYQIEICMILDLLVDDDIATFRLLKRQNIENRSDDTEDIIKNRLSVYHLNNQKIIDYYKLTPERYFGINSNTTILETFTIAHDIILEYLNR